MKLRSRYKKYLRGNIYDKYRKYTMIERDAYASNLQLVWSATAKLPMANLSVVECGSWRGGMTFGMMDVLPECNHFHIFDSFEGLPTPTDRDGKKATDLYDNELLIAKRNIADIDDVRNGVRNFGFSNRVQLHKGWFSDTVDPKAIELPIGVLRVDGDWYDSTKLVLEQLFDHVVPGGIIIIDDYYHWLGCAQAVHDFLSERKAVETIRVFENRVVYLVKREPDFLETGASSDEVALRRARNTAAGAARSAHPMGLHLRRDLPRQRQGRRSGHALV